ncbi:MAG: hypothetical protein AAB681_00815 [Patescibacteria group bacterium]
MKKTFITSLIALLAFVAPAFAEVKADLSASAQGAKDTPIEIKKPEIKPLTKKQKIEADLRSTSAKLKLVVDRTQTFVDLLTKREKDTTDAQLALDEASASLMNANTAIDQFVGIVPPEIISETVDGEIIKPKEVVVYKDPLKKAQEFLKSAKTSLIESIANLKDSLNEKESSE